MSKYRVRRMDGRIEGPMTSAELRALAATGRLQPTDEIGVEGNGRWTPAARVAGIREHLVRSDAAAVTTVEPEPDWGAIDLRPGVTAVASPARATDAGPHAAHARRGAGGGNGDAEHGSVLTVPQYGILRYVAEAIAAFGWLIIGLALVISILATLIELTFMPPWAALILAAPAGIGLVILMRRLAAQTSKAGWIALAVFLPLLPGLTTAANAARGDPELLILKLAPTMSLIGSLFAIAMFGLFGVAMGEFFNAHADIASNSWRRARG